MPKAHEKKKIPTQRVGNLSHGFSNFYFTWVFPLGFTCKKKKNIYISVWYI